MVSLLDIGELHEEVSVRGKTLRVTGISGRGILVLLHKFPEVRKLISNKGDDVSAEDLINLAPEAVACAIAAGCGMPGDVNAEEVASSLGVGEQLDLLEVILRLTFPKGIGPFVEKLTHLADSASAGVGSGWAQDMKSPARSSNSSQPATQQS